MLLLATPLRAAIAAAVLGTVGAALILTLDALARLSAERPIDPWDEAGGPQPPDSSDPRRRPHPAGAAPPGSRLGPS